MGYLDNAGLQYLWGKLKEKFAPKSHSHDDRYYTESEMDGKLNSKVNNTKDGASSLINKLDSATGIPVDSAFFVSQYSDGTQSAYYRRPVSTLWTYIKSKADGVYQPKGSYAASRHTHDDRYYTESEIDGKLTEKLHEETITDARDLNTIKITGVYHLKTASYTNGPGVSNHATIFVDYTVGTPYQIFIPDSVNRAWRRNHVNSNDTWSAWTELKYTDTNTWRGIQNNLTSDSTSDSLSAAQGKALKGLIDGKASSEHTHGLNSSSLTKSVDNATTNSWDMVGGNKSFLLRSLRMQSKAPDWLEGNYAAGIAFGGSDTKGVISHAYSSPAIKFAGGNGAAPVWWLRLTGTSGKTYDLNAMPPASHTHSFSSITDKPSTYTPSAHNQSWSTITDKPALMESGDYSAETIEALLKRVQGLSPRMGSCCFTKDTHVANTWWNFIYTPHRTGSGGDNPEYGTLLLFPMINAGSSYIVRAGKDGIVREVRKIYTSGDKPTKVDVGLGNVDNTADANKSVKYATSAGNASKVNNHTVGIDVPSNAKFTDTNTWRPVVNNLTSTATDQSLSAAMGKKLNDEKAPASGSNNYVRVWNSNSNGNNDNLSINDLAKQHFAMAMVNNATDNPLGGKKWIHAISMAWANNSNSSWVSQIALGVQDSYGMWFRTGQGAITGRAWNRVYDSSYHPNADHASAADSATNATNATTATKLSSNAGSSVQPVYFSGGKPVAIGYTISSSVPANAKFTDTTYGVASSSSNGLMSSTDKTKLDDFSRVINIQKQIKLTTDWLDTGIAGSSLDTGTYVVQVSGFNSSYTQLYSEIYSGVMSWYSGTTNSGNSSEIFLHNAGLADNNNAIYLRTLRVAGSKTLKLQIACKVAATGTDTLTFKFRRLI